MAVRQATRRYPDLASFLQDAEGTLAAGALLLPADQAGGDLALEIKLDLILPLVGRVGPIPAQVVARLSDGGVALRLPEISASVRASFQRVSEIIAEVQAHLLATGAVVLPPVEEPAPPEEVTDEGMVDDEASEDAPAAPAPPVFSSPVVPAAPPAPAAPAGPVVRGLLRPDLVGVVPMRTGTLEEGSLRRALVALALTQETGVLMVQTPDGTERMGYWQRGGPVGWRAEPRQDDETLGALLVRGNHLTEAQRTESLEHMERLGIRQGAALVGMGLLKREHVSALLARQSEFVLTRVLSEKAGRWSFYPLPDLPEPFPTTPVGVVGLLLRAFVSHGAKQPLKQLLQSLKKNQGRTIFLREAAVATLREMRYTREEALLFDALRVNPRPLGELLDKGPVPVETGAPVLWALLELGIVELGNAETIAVRDDRISERILAKKGKVALGTWFDVLEIHWICLPSEVEAAAKRLREEFSPAALGALPPNLQADITQILGRVDAAAQALRDPAARRAYRKTLFSVADIARCVALLQEQAEEARADEDEETAAQCLARVAELSG